MLVDIKGPFSLIKERKEDSMHFGSLIKSFQSIVDITRKVSSLMSLVAFIVFNNSFRVENHTYCASKWNIISERVMTQNPCSSGHVRVINVILNIILFSWRQTLITLFKYIKCVYLGTKCKLCHFEPNCTFTGLKRLWFVFINVRNQSFIYIYQSLCYFTFYYFILV